MTFENTDIVKIIDVEYFDSLNEKLERGDLILSDNSIRFIGYKDIDIKGDYDGFRTVRHFYNDDGYKWNKNQILLCICVHGIKYFNIQKSSIPKIDEYFKKINDDIILKSIEYTKKIELKVKELATSQYELFSNFLNISEIQRIFLVPYNIIAFETMLYSNTCIRDNMLLSSQDDRDTIDCKTILDNIADSIDNFTQMSKILNRKTVFESIDDCICTTWTILCILSIQEYSKLWSNSYGHFFENIYDLSLVECIKIFCSIDDFDTENYLYSSLFVYYLMSKEKFIDNSNFLKCNAEYIEIYNYEIEEIKLSKFESNLKKQSITREYSIDDVDLMGGHEFENFVSLMFSKLGYSTIVTKASGDQGIDVIAEKNGKKIGIQAKCYSSAVTNSAIQEVVAGVNHYNLDKAIVVTNNYFTKSAQELAESNNVVLWDRNMLKEKMIDVFS